MQNGLKNLLIVAGGAAALAAPAFGQAAATSNQRWNIRYTVERFFDPAEGGALASTEVWQTTWNGSAWSALSVISTTGDNSSKQNIGRVDITYSGRVAIVGQNSANPGDSTRPQGQRNYGVNRLGGSGSTSGTGFFMRFTDPSTFTQAGLQAHSLSRAGTGETRSNIAGDGLIRDVAGATGDPIGYTGDSPIAGSYSAFRVGFTPTGAQYNQGSNFDGNNGVISNPGTLAPVVLANLTGARGSNFGGEDGGDPAYTPAPLGVGQLDASNNITGGGFADFYKLSYNPKQDLSNVDSQVYRRVTVAIGGGANTNPRYLFNAASATNYSSGNGPNLPAGGQSFTFFVPTPGTAGLMGLAALAGLRRRR